MNDNRQYPVMIIFEFIFGNDFLVDFIILTVVVIGADAKHAWQPLRVLLLHRPHILHFHKFLVAIWLTLLHQVLQKFYSSNYHANTHVVVLVAYVYKCFLCITQCPYL